MPIDTLLESLRPGGRDFEHLCKWLLENVQEYSSQLKQVWLWDDWPGRRGRDIGIDLVAEDREGGLWAIQAKHYDPAYAIKKADLDSFLSASSRAEFTFRLLIATTDHLGPNARSVIAIQEKKVGTLLRSQLEALEVVWPSSITDLHPATVERKKPRPHQLRAIADCVIGLRDADRGQLVMACGTGKTLVGPFLAERMAANRLLVLVPSLSLLGQTLREWTTAIDLDYLAVCSDETVTKDEQDAVVGSTSELGIPVTTDPDRIARFLNRPAEGARVVFSTYQSSPQIVTAQASGVPFDLVIADEAHRCAGPQAGVFATVLDATKIKARKRLFMTATPRYFTGRVKKEAKEADWEVASMDEEQKFGAVLHRLSFGQAIGEDLLSDYQVVVVGVSDGEAHDLAERGAFVTRDDVTISDARTLARQIGLLRSMAKHDLHRVVTFHSQIAYASRFASSLPETNEWLPEDRRPTGQIWADHVSGKMTAGEREVRLRRLKAVSGDERGVLANARCLGEGVDVPTLDGVAFIDPRRSQVDVVQAVGRAIRKAEDKTLGTIVIPVLVDEDTDPAEALDSSEFDRVWEVVRALRGHDEVLAEEIDELRRGLGRRGSIGRRPAKIVLDLPAGIGDTFARAFDTKVVEIASASWEFSFGLLERFVAREGHARVPYHHVEDGNSLGNWVSTQRAFKRTDRLSAERVSRLEAVLGWTWARHESRWEEGFTYLERFVAREGHARVPEHHVEDDYALGNWVANRRRFKRTGRLSAERVSRLDGLPGWTWGDTRWEEGYSHLERFVAREGHARVPSKHLEDGYALGTWTSHQRRFNRSGDLSAERGARLEALPGWTWKARREFQRLTWDNAYSYLERFVAREGHARVPSGHREDDYPLGTWVGHQRQSQRKGKLSAERIVRLEALPSWGGAAWDESLSYLERFVAREGHARVPSGHLEDGYPLGTWTGHQRQSQRKGKLSAERIVRLEALPGWTWDARKKADS